MVSQGCEGRSDHRTPDTDVSWRRWQPATARIRLTEVLQKAERLTSAPRPHGAPGCSPGLEQLVWSHAGRI